MDYRTLAGNRIAWVAVAVVGVASLGGAAWYGLKFHGQEIASIRAAVVESWHGAWAEAFDSVATSTDVMAVPVSAASATPVAYSPPVSGASKATLKARTKTKTKSGAAIASVAASADVAAILNPQQVSVSAAGSAAGSMASGSDDGGGVGAVSSTGAASAASTANSNSGSDSQPSCTFADAVADPPARPVIFSEIAWMGSVAESGETASHASGREWIEFKNTRAAPVDISGWRVVDAGGKLKAVLPEGSIVASGQFYLLSRGGNPAEQVAPDAAYTGELSNAGGRLAILDTGCATSDYIDASAGWQGGNNATKQTMERDAGGVGWHTSIAPGGTPRAVNSVVAPAPQLVATRQGSNVFLSPSMDTGRDSTISPAEVSTAPDVQISPDVAAGAASDTAAEALASDTIAASPLDAAPSSSAATSSIPAPASSSARSDASSGVMIAAIQIAGASSSNDFVKIFNSGSAAAAVGGWKLRKKSASGADYSLKTFASDAVIPAGGWYVWANSEGGFSASIAADVSSTETLAADNSAAIIDVDGKVIDAVAWGTGQNQYVEGAPYPDDPGAGQVLVRMETGGAPVDTGDNSKDFVIR